MFSLQLRDQALRHTFKKYEVSVEQDRIKWDRKHQRITEPPPVCPLLERYWSDFGRAKEERRPPGQGGWRPRALDLACGLGQNSLFLARRGFLVDALDISQVALGRFEHELVLKHHLDLDDYQVSPNTYAMILNFRFLDRKLIPALAQGLSSGGTLLIQVALMAHSHPRNPAFKLEPGELPARLDGLRIFYYHEEKGLASLMAEKPIETSRD